MSAWVKTQQVILPFSRPRWKRLPLNCNFVLRYQSGYTNATKDDNYNMRTEKQNPSEMTVVLQSIELIASTVTEDRDPRNGNFWMHLLRRKKKVLTSIFLHDIHKMGKNLLVWMETALDTSGVSTQQRNCIRKWLNIIQQQYLIWSTMSLSTLSDALQHLHTNRQ